MSLLVNFRQALISSSGRRPIGRRFTAGAITKQGQGEHEKSPPVFELRTYSLHPDKMREYLDLTAKEFHLRTTHSKLVGFWTSEIGGLNQVVHIWEYGSLSERAGVRARLAGDPEWVGRYFGRILPWLQCQDNALLTLFPGTQLCLPTNKGVYELQTLQMQGVPRLWSKALSQWVHACQEARRDAGTVAVGVWESVLGPGHTAVVLWHHPGPDGCLGLADVASSLPEVETLAPLVTGSHSKLLLPHAVSPLQ